MTKTENFLNIYRIHNGCSASLKLMADGPSFSYSYQKRGTRNSYTSRIQVSHTRNVADDRDDKEFYILFFSW